MKDEIADMCAKRIANHITDKFLEGVAISLASAGEANPSKALFYAGAYTAARLTTSELGDKLQGLNALVSQVLRSIEPALEQAIQDCPDSPVTDHLLTARNAISRHSSAAWEELWGVQRAAFSELFGVKAEMLESETTSDFCAMADSLLSIGEEGELHPFYIWYAGRAKTAKEMARVLSKGDSLTSSELAGLVEKFKAIPVRSACVGEFSRFVIAEWASFAAVIRREAGDSLFPTVELLHRLRQITAEEDTHGAS